MARSRVAFQGEKGAFSEVAARQLLGESVLVLPCQRFDEIFTAVKDGVVNAAVVPIENTLHGSVHENYDHLLNFQLPICGETYVRVSHNLIALPGVRLRDIRKVYSHPVALNQCLKFLSDNPQLERVPFYDTAGSVKMIAEGGLRDCAAIASATAAHIYKGSILKRNIEDDPGNFTRFFLLRKRPARSDFAGVLEWKTSLVFSTQNIPGALFRSLSAFSLRDISLTKIESRPLRGKPWEYWFYLDFLGHEKDVRSQRALAHLAEVADFLRVFGSYPRGHWTDGEVKGRSV